MRWLLVLVLGLFSVTAVAALQSKEVTYSGGGAKMKGYIAWDDSFQGKRPGVLVVHEWWGHNAYARKRADMLAALGYVAMAVDMYGDGKTADHPKDAAAFMQEATKDPDDAAARFRAAEKILKKEKITDTSRLAAIGYCFGGAVVLNMARGGEELRGVASFHGALGAWEPAQPGAVKAKVLAMTGGDDSMVPPESVANFEREMLVAGADARVITYPGAKHSFTNPAADGLAKRFNMPIGYNAEADQASWAELQTFLREVFTQ